MPIFTDRLRSIEKFDSILQQMLDQHPTRPYDPGGLMYVGPPINEIEESEKEWFVHLLCMLMAFSMTIHASDSNNYHRLQTRFRIPIFEYGLTNTYYYPEELFNHFGISFRLKTLEEVFQLYEKYVKQKLSESKIDLNLEEVHRRIAADSDVNRGIWGRHYCELLQNRMTELFQSDFGSDRDKR